MRPTLRKVVLIALLGRDQPCRKHRSGFRSYFRLDRSQFDHLLQMVGARIARMDTNYGESISPVEHLAICLWGLLQDHRIQLPSWTVHLWQALSHLPRVLHNYLRRAFQELLRIEMGTPRGHLPDVTRAGANNTPRQELQVREKLTTYFSSPAGEVPWQHAIE
ncbi:unnamed protein product [Coregonus sp. 'balchen']|nr:unnamed protein product [Coregonus sp. 'balchen']